VCLLQVTLAYNLARVREACGQLKAAEAEYSELLRQFPAYGDCALRLACIAKARGDTKVGWGLDGADGLAILSCSCGR
jgi:RNA polymerase-associated protein CTR9